MFIHQHESNMLRNVLSSVDTKSSARFDIREVSFMNIIEILFKNIDSLDERKVSIAKYKFCVDSLYSFVKLHKNNIKDADKIKKLSDELNSEIKNCQGFDQQYDLIIKISEYKDLILPYIKEMGMMSPKDVEVFAGQGKFEGDMPTIVRPKARTI